MLAVLLTAGVPLLPGQTGKPTVSSKECDFPADIPRLPGASLSAFSTTGTTSLAYFVTGERPATAMRVYEEFAAREGWTVVPIPGPPLEKERVFIARKDKRTLRVDAVPNEGTGETDVFLLVVTQPPPPPPRAAPKVQP